MSVAAASSENISEILSLNRDTTSFEETENWPSLRENPWWSIPVLTLNSIKRAQPGAGSYDYSLSNEHGSEWTSQRMSTASVAERANE